MLRPGDTANARKTGASGVKDVRETLELDGVTDEMKKR